MEKIKILKWTKTSDGETVSSVSKSSGNSFINSTSSGPSWLEQYFVYDSSNGVLYCKVPLASYGEVTANAPAYQDETGSSTSTEEARTAESTRTETSDAAEIQNITEKDITDAREAEARIFRE